MIRIRHLATRAIMCSSTLLVVAASAAQNAGAQAQPASARCAAANPLIESGWEAWQVNRIAAADSLFRSAVVTCREAGRGWTGLGYVALRRDQLPLAVARFDSAFAVSNGRDADQAIGLGLATYRLGDLVRARAAFQRADSIAPGDSMVRGYLRRIPPTVDARALPARPRPAERVVAARAGRRVLEVPNGRGGWRPLWVKAVNLGAALPGKHPSEFPPDDGTYEGWIRDMAEMGANSIRVYTIHPPHFYRALRTWNTTRPDSTLWLIHGVWTELPPGTKEERYDDPEWNGRFLDEMQKVVDLLHGHAAIQPKPGHASGMYTADVSAWTLGYILGREWEPYSVQAYAALHPSRRSFNGQYLQLRDGNAVDVWLAQVADSTISYEMTRWNTQRPMAYTNWPTLDPLHHPTEASRAEEEAWSRRRQERVPEASREYDNDVIGLDATLMRATAAFPAGLFASYHAYPYYPDFMVLDSGYAQARSPEGRSNYFGYLKELVEHHGDMPVIISEYGVPSSRGNAHLQPQGWHHGGHDEIAQAAINARLTRDIAASGAAGAGLFALIDEWFKKNWLVIDFEQPAERNRLWLNALDAEQNYGVIAMRPGSKESAIVIDGRGDDWRGRTPMYRRASGAPAVPAAQRLDALWVDHDEAYVYLRVDMGSVDWETTRVLIGIDTYDPALGDVQLPRGGDRSPVGLEFVLDLEGPSDARLLVDKPYNLYRLVPIGGTRPLRRQSVYNRPFRSRANADGLYDTLWVTPNRRTVGRDGRVYEALRLDRNLLRHARQQATTRADWFSDPETGIIEIRLPWGMLHVTDPSSHQVLFGVKDSAPATATTDGFRFVVQTIDRASGRPRALLPRAAAGFGSPVTWRWDGWEEPRWYAERKPLFYSMRETFRAIPEAGLPARTSSAP